MSRLALVMAALPELTGLMRFPMKIQITAAMLRTRKGRKMVSKLLSNGYMLQVAR